MNPANAKNTKGVAKKAIAKAPVEAAAEAKLSVEDSASTGPLGSAFHAQVVSDSDGGQSGGGMGSTALILGGIALAGGIAVAAAGGGKDTDTNTVPIPTPTPPQPLPSYSVAASATSVNEGNSITFTITDANKVSGQKVTWSVNPERAADIDGPTSGEVTIDQSGKATVTIVVKADATTEGAETLTFTVGSQNASATINDTSTTPAKTMALTVNADTGADFVGTALGDTYNATAATFTALDSLDGAGGTDTLNILDQAGAMAGAAPATVTLKSIEKVNITSVGSIGVNAAAAVTAQAQIRTITPTGAVAGSTSTLTVTYGSVSVTTAALDGTVTAAEVNALVSAAINSIAGSAVSAVVGGAVVVTAPVAGTPLPTITVVPSTPGDVTFAQADTQSNVVGSAAKTAVEYDVSGAGYADVTDLTVNSVGGDNIKAAATQNVTVTNTGGGKVTIAGGLAQTVTQASGDVTLTGAAGAVKVTETTQAASDINVTGGTTVDVTSLGATTGDITVTGGAATTGITVNANHAGAGDVAVTGGTTVSITSTAKNDGGTTGTITVGSVAAAPTGNVTINSTISEAKSATSTAGGAITVTGGAAVTVNQVATKAVQTADGLANGTITNAAVVVNGTATTTSVTAKASAAVTAANTVLAVAGVTEVSTVTFGALTAGQTLIINGLTFTAGAAGTTAAQTAAAFANLTAGATQGNSTLGVYSGTFNGASYTSGAVGGTSTAPTVAFTGTATGNLANITLGGNGAGVSSTVVTTAGVDAVTAAGKTGVTANSVTITDVNNGSATKAGTITTATAENYTTFTFNGNALTTLNLTGGSGNITIANGGLTSPTNKTLALTVNGLTGGVLDDANIYTTLNVTATGKSSTLADITDTALTALNVAGDKTLTLTSTAGATALANVSVTGSAGLKATFVATTMKAIDTTGTTGTSTITFDATAATYTGGAGVDLVATSAIAPTKAISLGGGDDKLSLFSGTVSVTGAIAGGTGTDTLSMVVADAALADDNLGFSALVTGFEVLELTGSTGNQSVNLANLTLTNKVVVGAQAAAGTLTLDGLVSGGTLTINGARATSGVTVTNSAFATPTTDSLNIAITNIGGSGDINAGTVTAANVETINISVNDGDQVIPADSHSLVLTADKATTVVITNDNTIDTVSTNPTSATDNTKLDLTMTGSTKVTLIDGSAMTGGLTVTSVNTTSATTIKGGLGADALTAATGTTADILLGGAGADTLTSNAGLTTLTGGAGNDLFVTATAGANGNVYTTITDASAGDRIQLKDVVAGSETFTAAKLGLAATASFADYLDFATDSTTAHNNGAITWFQYGNNTYIVQDVSSSADFVAGQDIVIALNGLIDLSKASLSYNGAGAPVLQIG